MGSCWGVRAATSMAGFLSLASPLLMLVLLLLLTAASEALNITVEPGSRIVYMEFPMTITVKAMAGTGSFRPVAPGAARCNIRSCNTNFVDQNYTATGYNPMKNLSATLVDATTLTCTTVPTQNGSPAHVSVSMDNGQTWSTTAVVEVVPAFEWALSRRPYFAETEGAIVYRAHPSLAGKSLQLVGRLRPHHGNESSGGAFTPHYFDRHTRAGLALAAAPPLIDTAVTIGAAADSQSDPQPAVISDQR